MNILKRLFDIVLSLLTLILVSPILIILSILIKIDSNGPILFKQKRITKNGTIFIMYKLRSMVIDAETKGTGLFNYENDPRVTRVGRFLRKSSLDELPQLWNILKGNMSIVGPRPPVEYELGEYDNLNDEYKNRFRVRAGITGLAQVKGRNELEWDQKVKFDNIYIEKFNKYGIFIDIKIIFLTIVNVFWQKNIYEEKNETHGTLSDIDIAEKAAREVIEKASNKKLEKN